MPDFDKKVADTPDNTLLRKVFGEDISLKEALIVAAAVIIILGALTGS